MPIQAEVDKCLPCPFCGSPNIDPRGWMSRDSAGPACDDCGAAAGYVGQTPEGNLEVWNKRVQEPLFVEFIDFVITTEKLLSYAENNSLHLDMDKKSIQNDARALIKKLPVFKALEEALDLATNRCL